MTTYSKILDKLNQDRDIIYSITSKIISVKGNINKTSYLIVNSNVTDEFRKNLANFQFRQSMVVSDLVMCYCYYSAGIGYLLYGNDGNTIGGDWIDNDSDFMLLQKSEEEETKYQLAVTKYESLRKEFIEVYEQTRTMHKSKTSMIETILGRGDINDIPELYIIEKNTMILNGNLHTIIHYCKANWTEDKDRRWKEWDSIIPIKEEARIRREKFLENASKTDQLEGKIKAYQLYSLVSSDYFYTSK